MSINHVSISAAVRINTLKANQQKQILKIFLHFGRHLLTVLVIVLPSGHFGNANIYEPLSKFLFFHIEKTT